MLGFVLLVVLTALWAVVYVGFMQLIALEDAQRRGDQLRRPGLLPAAVPDAELRAAQPAHAADGDRRDVQPGHVLMEALRSLILEDLAWSTILPGFAVVAVAGAVMLALNVRMIQHYD